MTQAEREILADTLTLLGSRSDLRLWRANSGVARALTGDHVVKFGINGQADLSGILNDGRRLEIELKSAHGRQSEAQLRFAAMIARFGGIYILARSADDALGQLQARGYCRDQ